MPAPELPAPDLNMQASQHGAARNKGGIRGFELDIHLAFRQPLPTAEAARVLLVLEGFMVDLYRPHPRAMPGSLASGVVVPDVVPSARLTGPLRDAEVVRGGLQVLLEQQARYAEVGLRGFLRSSTGQTEWMPWRKTVVLRRDELGAVRFEEGIRYVLE